MRTRLEFLSDDFPPYPGEEEEVNPGVYGKRLAEFLAAELPRRGFAVTTVFAEDWGWTVELQNDDFPLWIGCANYGDDGFLCFIEPSKPFVRHWLKQIPTTETVEPLAAALEQIVRDSGKARDLRWWTEAGPAGADFHRETLLEYSISISGQISKKSHVGVAIRSSNRA